MQTTTQPKFDFQSASGFAPIPTRIGDVPPLVVDQESNTEVQQRVVSMLHELGEKVAHVHRAAAEAYLSQGLYREALPHLEAAVQFAPEQTEHVNQLGFVRYIAGDDAGALQSFKRVLERSAGNPDALFNMGMVLFGQSDHVRAEDCFRRSLEARPNDAEAWNNRGVCMHKLSRPAEAVACFKRALELEPENADAKANLADVTRARGSGW
jgi:Flp pilus assembly protein TadD